MKPSVLAHVKHILLTLKQSWSVSGDTNAFKCSQILNDELDSDLDEVLDIKSADIIASPGGLCMKGTDPLDSALLQTLFMSWDKLTWIQPKKFRPPVMEDGAFKEALLIGPDGPLKSNKIEVSIFCVAANTKVPRHSEDAIEMIHILEGNEINIGFAVDDWLVKAKYHYFPATFPKVMKTTETEHFVAISVKTGNLRGRFWLNDTDEELGFKYQDVAKLEKDEVESYYDMVAKDYARAMINWGYCMPEILSNAVVINGGVSPTSNIKVIDMGCGDGAIGEAMMKKGFRDIVGVDISQSMLNIAESKGCYNSIKKADLLKPMPFDANHFDVLVTAGVTTYLEPSALEFWLKIMKPGGILCIVHKAAVWPKWQDQQDKFVASKVWEKVWINEEPVPYLPSLNVPGTDRAKIYIYRKL